METVCSARTPAFRRRSGFAQQDVIRNNTWHKPLVPVTGEGIRAACPEDVKKFLFERQILHPHKAQPGLPTASRGQREPVGTTPRSRGGRRAI